MDRRIGGQGGGDSLGFTWPHYASPDSLELTWTHFDSLGLTWIYSDSLYPTGTHLDSLALTWTHWDTLGLAMNSFGIRRTRLVSLHPSRELGRPPGTKREKGRGRPEISGPDLTAASILSRLSLSLNTGTSARGLGGGSR